MKGVRLSYDLENELYTYCCSEKFSCQCFDAIEKLVDGNNAIISLVNQIEEYTKDITLSKEKLLQAGFTDSQIRDMADEMLRDIK